MMTGSLKMAAVSPPSVQPGMASGTESARSARRSDSQRTVASSRVSTESATWRLAAAWAWRAAASSGAASSAPS